MGLFVRPFGGRVFLAPPLIFTKAQADRAVGVLDRALAQVEARVLSRAARGGAREPVGAAT
jgi:adenosylmethionine-8-amino-7-oxononanoate aminotransferase